MIDVVKARTETPGCQKVLHFNNAGASLMPQVVLDSMIGHLQQEAQIGGYEAAAAASAQLAHTYAMIARLIGCQPDEIAVVENATRAWDMAFYAIPFQAGDRILTSVAEYASNYIAFLQVARKFGVQVDVVPNDEHGQLSVAHLQQMIDERVKLIAISHVPSTGGLVQPAAEVGRIARAHNILYLLDACQSVGQIQIDVQEIGCHMLSATGRKYLRGPRGIGFLYVEGSMLDMLEPPMLDLHAATWVAADRYELRPDARRFENWEANIAAKVGLGVAVEYALGWDIAAIEERVQALAAQLREELSGVAGVTVRDLGAKKCGIVTFDTTSKTPQQVKDFLAAEQINVSISPVSYSLLDLGGRGLSNLVRASVHYYNTAEEIERFCAMLRKHL